MDAGVSVPVRRGPAGGPGVGAGEQQLHQGGHAVGPGEHLRRVADQVSHREAEGLGRDVHSSDAHRIHVFVANRPGYKQ